MQKLTTAYNITDYIISGQSLLKCSQLEASHTEFAMFQVGFVYLLFMYTLTKHCKGRCVSHAQCHENQFIMLWITSSVASSPLPFLVDIL